MATYDGSRYAEALVLRVKDAAGDARPTLYSMILANPLQVDYKRYIMMEGETYSTLADRLFNDPTQWWRIADLNPEFLYPDDLPPGAVIRLPNA